MIVPIADLIAELRKQPKFYLQSEELGMRTFYNAAQGKGTLTLRTREALLAIARGIWPGCTGLLLADGGVHYSSALVAEMAERIVALEAENARLRRQAEAFTQRAFRQLTGAGRLAPLPAPLTHRTN